MRQVAEILDSWRSDIPWDKYQLWSSKDGSLGTSVGYKLVHVLVVVILKGSPGIFFRLDAGWDGGSWLSYWLPEVINLSLSSSEEEMTTTPIMTSQRVGWSCCSSPGMMPGGMRRERTCAVRDLVVCGASYPYENYIASEVEPMGRWHRPTKWLGQRVAGGCLGDRFFSGDYTGYNAKSKFRMFISFVVRKFTDLQLE